MAKCSTPRTAHASPTLLGALALALLVCLHANAQTSAPAPYEIAAASPAPAAAAPAAEPNSALPISIPGDASLSNTLHPFSTSFEPGPNEQYTMDDGDLIHLDFAGRPELSADYTIGPDGRITVPAVGSILLSGLTREEASAAIESAMQPFYRAPHITVGVLHYNSNHILLLGAVQRPGLLDFDDPPTLLQVLSRGGIGSDNAQMNDSGNVNSTAYGSSTAGGYHIPDRAFIYRGSQEVAVVDLKRLLSGGAFADLRLRRNDIVLIPVENQLVSVLGAVRTPGAIRFNPTSSLQVLLSQAGGLAEQAGSNPLIHVVNPTTGTEATIRFRDLLNPRRGNDVSLHAGDVIFVPSSEFAKFAYVVDKMNPILTVIAFATLAANP